ncbi:hypothetical protein CVH13_01127, partial [Dehalococcoides mccartyi]
ALARVMLGVTVKVALATLSSPRVETVYAPRVTVVGTVKLPLALPPLTVAVVIWVPPNNIQAVVPFVAVVAMLKFTRLPAGPEFGYKVMLAAAETGESGKATISKAKVENTPNTRSKNLCFII